MPKRADKKKNSPLSFEESLEQLQQIVENLEEGSGGLEQSMQDFEQGIGLLRACYETLESAEQKIELLTAVDEKGNVATEDFDATSTVERKRKQTKKQKKAEEETDDDESDEQRLF